MKYKYFLFINDYEVVRHDPLEIISEHPLNLGDIISFGMNEIGEELDIEYDTMAFRVVQRFYSATSTLKSAEMLLTVIPHFDGVNL